MARWNYSTAVLQSAQPGLSKLAAALSGGDQAYQAGFDGTATAQTKIAQALAQIRESQAAAGLHQAQADEVAAKKGILDRRPDLYREQVANSAGVDGPTVDAYRTQLQTGRAPIVPMGPPTEEGQLGAGEAAVPIEARSKIAGALQQFLPLLSNSGDLKPDDLAKAAQLYRESGLSDAIIAGAANRNVVGGAQAAAAGKDLYSTDSAGGVLDRFTGGLDATNPLARSTIGLRGAQAGEAAARAGLARAQTTEVGAGKFDAGSGTIIDARTGRATPVIDVTTGKPIGGKASGSLNQEQANALTFASRMQASDQILGQLAQGGVTQPGGIKRVAEALPFVGEAAGAMTNWTQSPQQQQVEQAQRDFINAVLRRESGAAISQGEFANAAQQYFPQPGDKPAVLAQKAAARKRVIQGMLAAVPPGQRELPSLPGTSDRTVPVDY